MRYATFTYTLGAPNDERTVTVPDAALLSSKDGCVSWWSTADRMTRWAKLVGEIVRWDALDREGERSA